MEKATFGAGCFWCTEAVFQRIEGVISVVPGFAGGHVKNPAYREVVTGRTGHAEVAQITFDPAVITYEELLEIFWKTHDPTTLNRQGNDVGTQYRSAIFFHDEFQKVAAEQIKAEIEKARVWSDPIVTEIVPLAHFYPAENYHQNYFNLNQEQPYCTYVIRPKVEKLQQIFNHRMKGKVK